MKSHIPIIRERWSGRLPRRLSWFFFLLFAGRLVVGADDTNIPVARAPETNSVVLSAVDTNSTVFSTLGTNSAALIEARSVSLVDLQSFRMIWERNIFNPNRSPGSRRIVSAGEPGKTTRTESFTLVGTMSYEKGRFAFFESSSSQYQKVLEVSGAIAGYKIADITPARVKLESTNGQTIELPVGMQMKKEEAGEWGLASRAESSPKTEVTGEASEVLKRLMQKREQEGSIEPTNTLDAPLASTEKITAETPEKAAKTEKTEAGSAGGADEILKKLLQKREQELNK